MQPIRKIGMVKWQKGQISVVASYLTLGHKNLYKEIKAPLFKSDEEIKREQGSEE